MPSEKRIRQRELRQAKVAEEQRHVKRMRSVKRAAVGLVVIAIVIGLVVLLSSTPAKKPKGTSSAASTSTTAPATSPSTTAPATSPTTTPPPPGIQTVSTPTVPTCPPASGTTKRYIDFTSAPPNCLTPGASYSATVTTDVGSFVIKLLTSTSATAVNNFVFLSRNHFYDGTIFHRVIPGFMDQGGDPTGTGTGGPGYSWTGNTPSQSCVKTANCYPIGGVAMANTGTPSSNGSQFFIVTGTTGEQLPPSYTLFGQVVSGMAVVQKINADGNASPSANGVPPKVTHHIVGITIHQS